MKTGLIRRSVRSPRNSYCGSARLEELDWSIWWTGTAGGQHYLHVQHKDGETIHRVFCRLHECPRLEMWGGKLMWLIDREADRGKR